MRRFQQCTRPVSSLPAPVTPPPANRYRSSPSMVGVMRSNEFVDERNCMSGEVRGGVGGDSDRVEVEEEEEEKEAKLADDTPERRRSYKQIYMQQEMTSHTIHTSVNTIVHIALYAPHSALSPVWLTSPPTDAAMI